MSSHPDHPAEQLILLDLPTTTLLDKFGAGSHKPGSGSAAALMGILSLKLIQTVCKLTASKPKYSKTKSQVAYILERIETEIEPALRDLFHQDAEIFDKVISARVVRDKATESNKAKLSREHLDLLKEATNIPFEIGRQCLALIDCAIYLFDSGFQSARGDSGAAVSAAIAGVSSAIFVMNLNLRSFKQSKWKDEYEEAVGRLTSELQSKQLEAFARITKLSEKEFTDMDLFDFANASVVK